MNNEYRIYRPSSRHIRTIFVIAMLILVCALCSGCLKPPTANNAKSGGSGLSESASRPDESFEGYWLCSGYKSGTSTVSFNNLSPEEKKSFPYFVLELGKGGGNLSQINDGDGEYRMLFGGDIRSTSDGIRLVNEDSSLDLAQSGERLLLLPEAATSLETFVNKTGLYPDFKLPHNGATYYFEKPILGSQLQVTTFVFDGVSLDVPIDVAYTLDGKNPDTSDKGGISVRGASYRRHGPEMDFSSYPTNSGSIAEVIAEAEGQEYPSEHADEFAEHGGVQYHLHSNEELNYSRLGFVADGKLYEIVLNYDDEDVVDYSDYRKRFFTTIQFVGEDAAPAQSDAISSGAISWQETAQHIGETVTVIGPVADIEYASSSDGQPTFIDLGVAYPNQNRVTMVVWGEDRNAFPKPPEEMYQGKTLRVTGEVYMHEGVCNIKVTSPTQVQIFTE